jgi:hypothetical protein
VLPWRIQGCNSGYRGHSDCKSALRNGNGHRDRIFQAYPSAVYANGRIDGDVRFVKYLAGNVAVFGGCGARHRVWLGGWGRCRACFSIGWADFYPICHVRASAAPDYSPFFSRTNPDDAAAVAGMLTFALRANVSIPATKIFSIAIRRLAVTLHPWSTPDFYEF